MTENRQKFATLPLNSAIGSETNSVTMLGPGTSATSSPTSKAFHSPALSRRSLIPIPVQSTRTNLPQASVLPPNENMSVSRGSSDTSLGITESTPSFLTFTASMDDVANDDELEENGDHFSAFELPTVDNIAEGEGRATGISTTSRSFTGFMNQVDGRRGVLPRVSAPTTLLNLTRGERFQASDNQDQQSKNETRHRKHRRLRINNYPVLSEEKFLRLVNTTSSLYYSTVQIQSGVSAFRLYDPIEFPTIHNKKALKELMKECRIPNVFQASMIPRALLTGNPETSVPLNLKRLSQQELELLFVLAGNRVGALPVTLSPQIEMFPTHDKNALMGSLFIQNRSPHIVTFQIQASIGNRYELNPAVGQISIGSGAMVLVKTLENLGLGSADINGDQFLVDVIPLTAPFYETVSLMMFWKCPLLGKSRFLINLVEPIKKTDLGKECLKEARLQEQILTTFALSNELFQMRYLENESIANQQSPRKQIQNGQDSEELQYGLVFGSILFGFLLMAFMTFVLYY